MALNAAGIGLAEIVAVEAKRTLWKVISGLPAVIVGLAAVVFPEFGIALFVAAVVLLGSATAAWVYVSFQGLQKENKDLRGQLSQKPREPASIQASPTSPPSREWRLMEEIDLLLDGSWEHTRTFDLRKGMKMRTTAEGRNRFIIHLADGIFTEGPRRKWWFNSVERSSETKRNQRTWDIKKDGRYTFVLEPVGIAAVHVLVRVEEFTNMAG